MAQVHQFNSNPREGNRFMPPERDLRCIAMAFDGTIAAPYFERAAFKASRIYATPAADGLMANQRAELDR